MISFDIFAFFVIGLSVLYSVWKGMVREAFSLVALVLGGFFGMAKGIFLMIVFMFPLQWFDESYARWTENSLVAPYLEDWVDDIRESVELEPGFNKSLPGSLKGMRPQMPSIQEIEESIAAQKEKLQEKTSTLTQLDSPPLDEHTQEDQENLDKILNKISEK